MIPKLESKHEPLAPTSVFYLRLVRSFLLTVAVVAASLSIGMLGYHWIGGLEWMDSLYNAAMILTGMGPVDPMKTAAGKLFATFYALFSGIVFLSLVAILIGPIYHRFLHRFHLEEKDDDAS